MVPGKPLSRRQKARIARAVEAAEDWTGVEFCVYLGPVAGDPRERAHELMAELGLADREAVLLLAAPDARRVEIVTSERALRRVPDQASTMAAIAMSASFQVGDVAGGVREAVRLLAQAAGPGERAGADLPDVVETLP